MTIRGVHIEVIEEMSASCFINALRRFKAIRGQVKCLYSDCGTNFTGAHNELQRTLKEMTGDTMARFLENNDMQWKFKRSTCIAHGRLMGAYGWHLSSHPDGNSEGNQSSPDT